MVMSLYKLKEKDLKEFFNKIFVAYPVGFDFYCIAGDAHCFMIRGLSHIYSKAQLSLYDIEIKPVGKLPEEYKYLLKEKGVDKDGGLAHIEGRELYDEYFSLMLKTAYEAGVLEEYKKGLVTYWTNKLIEIKDRLMEAKKIPIDCENLDKMIETIDSWIDEFDSYIDKKCEEIKKQKNISSR